MKKLTTCIAIGVLLVLGGARSSAQTNTTFVTNLVQVINVALNGFAQNSADTNSMTLSPVHITTRNIVDALGTATGKTFSRRAALLLVSPLGGGNTTIVVRDIVGGAVEDTDVSGFFGNSAVGTPVERSNTTASGRTVGIQYSIQTYSLSGSGGLTFNVQGFTSTALANDSFVSSVNGTGTSNGSDAVLRGAISAGPQRVQRVAQ